MKEREEDSTSNFKVVDKRRFLSEDELATHEHNEPLQTDSCSHGCAHDHGSSEEHAQETSDREPSKIDFSVFAHFIAHQVMMGLGMVPWFDSGAIKTDFAMAKESIDILTMLQEKTKNNLTSDEESLINGMLYQLRMSFVEITKQNLDVKEESNLFIR